MLHKKYEEELKKYNELIARKNVKSDFYNGIYERYEYPVLTREHIPLTWRYDLWNVSALMRFSMQARSN